MDQLIRCTGFQWDEGNTDKSWLRHKVTWTECEEIFFNHPLRVLQDKRHSGSEGRYYALGRTNADRSLFVAFTIRGDLIRVISGRAMSRRERKEYANADQESTQEDSSL